MIEGVLAAISCIKTLPSGATRDQVIDELLKLKSIMQHQIQFRQDTFGTWYAMRGDFRGFATSPYGVGATTDLAKQDLLFKESNYG